jgi:carbon monoxide dehydrogenase subunit G
MHARLGPPLIGLAAVLALSPAAVAGDRDAVTVDVVDRGGVFSVTGHFTVAAPDERTWRVLTDYDRFGAFIPTMRSNTVERTGPRSALVEQETTTTFLAFSKTNRVVLKVDEEPYKQLRFTDVSGRDFEVYRGAWRLTSRAGETRVDYQADAKPRFMPPTIGPSIMTRTVRSLLEDLRNEVLRRQAAGR